MCFIHLRIGAPTAVGKQDICNVDGTIVSADLPSIRIGTGYGQSVSFTVRSLKSINVFGEFM